VPSWRCRAAREERCRQPHRPPRRRVPFFPPRGPNAGRVSACHRFPRFAGVGVARHTRSGSIATGRCFASVPFHMYTVGRAGAGSCVPFCHCGSRAIRDFICMRDRAPLLEPGLEGGRGSAAGSARLCTCSVQRAPRRPCSGVCSVQLRWARSQARLSLSESFSLSLGFKKINFTKRIVTKQYSWGPSYNPSTRWQSTRRARGRWSAPRTLVAALAICWLSRSAWRRAEDTLFKTRSREMSALPQKSYPHSRRIRLSHCEAQLMAHAPMLPCSHAPMLPTGVPAW